MDNNKEDMVDHVLIYTMYTDTHSKSFLYYVPFTIFDKIGPLGIKKQDGFSPLHGIGNRLDVPGKSSKQPALGMGLK